MLHSFLLWIEAFHPLGRKETHEIQKISSILKDEDIQKVKINNSPPQYYGSSKNYLEQETLVGTGFKLDTKLFE